MNLLKKIAEGIGVLLIIIAAAGSMTAGYLFSLYLIL